MELNDEKKKGITEFLGSGFDFKTNPPPSGFPVRFIDDKFDVHEGEYYRMKKFIETNDAFIKCEKIIAWKHV